MQKIPIFLAVSLILTTFIAGVTTGFYISPHYQMTMYDKKAMDLGTADLFVDLRYINSMAGHHMEAILLAQQIEEKTTRPELLTLAREIQANEPKLIAELYAWKRAWYRDSTPVRNPQVVQLGAADETVDLRFLNALIAHHEAGITMTREIRAKSNKSEILNNADAVEQFLLGSLTNLKKMRKEWFTV